MVCKDARKLDNGRQRDAKLTLRSVVYKVQLIVHDYDTDQPTVLGLWISPLAWRTRAKSESTIIAVVFPV